jgi:hypothetical protein
VNLSALIAKHGLSADTLAGRGYPCRDPSAVLVPLHRIARADRFVIELPKIEAILAAIAADQALPPIRVLHNLVLRDGHHRFAVSQVLGAAIIPMSKR